jgi:hypothetical protein
MNAPLANYLTRFSTESTEGPVAIALLGADAFEPMVTLGAGELEARLDDARRSARDAADAASSEERERLCKEHETAMAEALALARADWCATTADQLAASVEGALRTLHEALATAIAHAIRPLLADAVRERTLTLLSAAIDRLLEDPSHPVITVRGPADLVAALLARHARDGLQHVEADTPEITITAAGALIETRLEAALAELAQTEI